MGSRISRPSDPDPEIVVVPRETPEHNDDDDDECMSCERDEEFEYNINGEIVDLDGDPDSDPEIVVRASSPEYSGETDSEKHVHTTYTDWRGHSPSPSTTEEESLYLAGCNMVGYILKKYYFFNRVKVSHGTHWIQLCRRNWRNLMT